MVLIALAIVFGGLGALSLTKSDSGSGTSDSGPPGVAPVTSSPAAGTGAQPGLQSTTTVAPEATTPPTTTLPPTSTTPATTTPASGTVDKSVPVRVLNNSTVTGLASQTASELQSNGWDNVSTGNYASGSIAKTTVYYGSSAAEQAAAEEIARQLGVSAEPRFPGIASASEGVIVIVTSG